MLKDGWRWEGRSGRTVLIDPAGDVAGVIGGYLPPVWGDEGLWIEAHGRPSCALDARASLDEAREALARLVVALAERLGGG